MSIIWLISEIIFTMIRWLCYAICWIGILALAFVPLYLAFISNVLFLGLYGVYIAVIIFGEYLYTRMMNHDKAFR